MNVQLANPSQRWAHPKQNEAFHPAVPAILFAVSATSRPLLARGNTGVAMCGVANIHTGAIDLRPLVPDPDYKNVTYTDPIGMENMASIEHFDPAANGAVSHEQLVALLEGQQQDYIGFTVKLGDPAVLVCTSRSLNAPKFTQPVDMTDGKMNAAWATAVLAALGEVAVVFQPLPPQ